MGRQRQKQHKQGHLQFASTITYTLWEGKGRNSISRSICSCKHNHLHTVGRQRQKQHKHGHLQFPSTITYSLWEGKGRNSISKVICSLQAQSLTSCGKAKAETAKARSSAVCKHNHSHTVGKQRQKEHKQGHLQYASTITYRLWEGKGRNSISKVICSLQAQSLTPCGKAKAETA